MSRLKVLVEDSGDALVDVVLVHSLDIGSRSTWTKDGFFWPPQFLPEDLPSTRLFLFDYRKDDDDEGKGPWYWLDVVAQELLALLQPQRPEPLLNKRPLMLLAHGLGGLVCARALSLSETSKLPGHPLYLAFFGAPLANFKNVIWKRIAPTLADLRDPDLQKAREMGENFDNLLAERSNGPGKIRFHAFFESQEQKHGPAVPKASAIIEKYPCDEIPTKHSEMCRFGEDKIHYDKVSKVLRDWAQHVKTQKAPVRTDNTTITFSGEFISAPAVGVMEGSGTVTGGHVQITNWKTKTVGNEEGETKSKQGNERPGE